MKNWKRLVRILLCAAILTALLTGATALADDPASPSDLTGGEGNSVTMTVIDGLTDQGKALLNWNIQFRIGERFFQRQAAGFIQEFHDLPNPFRYAGIFFPEFIGDQIGLPEMLIVFLIIRVSVR